MPTLQSYIDLLAPQHRGQPKLTAWLSAAAGIAVDIQTCFTSMLTAFDIETATGAQLDIIGRMLGVERRVNFQPSGGVSPVLTDTYYRLVLRAKILLNQWDGTRDKYDEMLSTIFADYPMGLYDFANMSFDVIIFIAEADPMITDLLTHGYLFPAPAGIQVGRKAVAEYTWDWYFYMNQTWNDVSTLTWDEMGGI